MFDLLIKAGTIVDGTGAARFVADIGVVDGVIVAVGSDLDGDAAETIDATGLLVTPGFVDIHTHYDGQATWDPVLDPSASHGVTTVVMGNCGVGFAPVRPGQEAWLVELMEGVEDIPGTALHEGIQWEWETFPEYLDALDRRQLRTRRRRVRAACAAPCLCDGRTRRRQRRRNRRRHRGHGGPRPCGDRGGRRRVLDVTVAQPQVPRRRARPGHLRRPRPSSRASPGRWSRPAAACSRSYPPARPATTPTRSSARSTSWPRSRDRPQVDVSFLHGAVDGRAGPVARPARSRRGSQRHPARGSCPRWRRGRAGCCSASSAITA